MQTASDNQSTSTRRQVGLLLTGRALRGFSDGYVAVLLPAYLLALGMNQLDVGLLSTASLLGAACMTLAVGVIGHRWPQRTLMRLAALLMAATGVSFAGFDHFWPLMAVAFIGTLNPTGGDIGILGPIEHSRLAASAAGNARTSLFARYSLIGALSGACGALASGLPEVMHRWANFDQLSAMRVMFMAYTAMGLVIWVLYRNIQTQASANAAVAPLGPSRVIVWKLAALFSLDSFAGGLMLNALMALWLFERYGLPLPLAGAFFFWTGLLSAGSQLAAPWVARRFGLLNTMVYTHLPSSICLVLAALAPQLEWSLGLLLLRSALSQMDIPTRSAFVMAVVSPAERTAAASFTALPRSLAAALSPSLAGALLAAGLLSAPLLLCGGLKIGYDIALLVVFKRQRNLDLDGDSSSG